MSPFQSVRVSNLPSETIVGDLEHFFQNRLRRRGQRPIIDTIGPLCVYGARPVKRTTVTFWTNDLAKQAVKLHGQSLQPVNGGAPRPIGIDTEFSDLTTLYAPNNREPNADFIILHGLSSHPWTAFTSVSSHEKGSKEYMWLRDTLPEFMQASGIFPRVMTYGWNANVWIDSSNQRTTEAAMALVHNINAVREQCPTRPLFFFGHSLGGVVVKQAVNEMVDAGLATAARDNAPAYQSPVKGCFFFATPHQGSDLANSYATVLSLLKGILILGTGPSDTLIQELKEKATEFARISGQFDQVRHEHQIETISCFEQKPILGRIVVPQASAVLDYDLSNQALPHNAFPVDADHREIVRFSSAEHSGFNAIMSAVARIVQAALSPDRPLLLPRDNSDHVTSPPTDTELEPVLAHLMRFDTIFLVDDSGSMFGPRWAQARGALAAVVDLAVKYDRDGVDIRFFNDEDHRGDNLTSSIEVMDLFDKVLPNGVTPTEDAMEQELGDYMVKWKKQKRKTKKLNLIVLTDGEPDEDNHVEQMIVKYAKELDREGASKNQVGIQFVQIGDDAKATKFLKMLDNDLKRRYGIERDMVDTVPWNSQKFAGRKLYEKILLGGILARIDDEEEETDLDVAGLGIRS